MILQGTEKHWNAKTNDCVNNIVLIELIICRKKEMGKKEIGRGVQVQIRSRKALMLSSE